MNEIVFPVFNLNLKISKIAFSIGNISIYWYAIFIVFALIISLIIFKIKDGKYNIRFKDVFDLIIFVIPISIICARVYYVLFNLDYYINFPMEIFNLKAGGLAIYGGIIGGGLTCIFYCKKKKIDVLNLLDFIVPCLALRTGNRKMGKFCKYRSIWDYNKTSMENGNYGSGAVYRSSSNIFI